MNTEDYIYNGLEPVAIPYPIYHQDHVRPHTAAATAMIFRGSQILLSPSRSPHILPINHIWNMIGGRMEPFFVLIMNLHGNEVQTV